MRSSPLLAALFLTLLPGSAPAQTAQGDINYGVGPPSPYEGRDMNFDFKYGDPKRDAEVDRARRAQPQKTVNTDDFVSLDKVSADRLEKATVENASGIAIGRVTNVTSARDGSITELEISLDKAGKLRVPAEDLRFNPTERMILVANPDNGAASSLAAGENDSPQ